MSLEELRRKHGLPCLGALHGTKSTSLSQVAVPPKHGNSMTKSCQFILGSLTKAMTATLIAILVNEGLIQWDGTIEDVLSSSGEIDPSNRTITIRDLAAHRSGLEQSVTLRPMFAYGFWDVNLSPTDARVRAVHDVLSKPAAYTRGSFHYANVNYIILAHIVDRLGRGPYETVIKERLFRPLEMLETGFGPIGGTLPAPYLPGFFPRLFSIGMSWLPLRFHALPPVMNSAGSVRCSLDDYSKFLRLHADGANGMVQLGLSVEDFRFLHEPYLDDGGEIRYTNGGWIRPIEEDNGLRNYSLFHTGANLFYESHAHIDVRKEISDYYVAATNRLLGREGCIEAVKAMRSGQLKLASCVK